MCATITNGPHPPKVRASCGNCTTCPKAIRDLLARMTEEEPALVRPAEPRRSTSRPDRH